MSSPSIEHWQAIQGGAPYVMLSPSGRSLEIIHAYRQANGSHEGPLAVVPTPREQLLATVLIQFALPTGDAVTLPAALLWRYHGQPCEMRSGAPYPRLDPTQVDDYLQHRARQGWNQLDLGINA